MKKRFLVALKLAGLSVPGKIEKARFIVSSMTGNANFSSPSPGLAVITTGATNLETARIAADGGGKTQTAALRAAEETLDRDLTSLAMYVQAIANNSPDSAETIIHSSGMQLKSSARKSGGGFVVKNTGETGQVLLRTRHKPRVSYTWQLSTDINNPASWVSAGISVKASCLVNDLNPGTKYFFRVAEINKEGQHGWSDSVSIIVQ